jgi:peptidoglycan/xylan/chitin deacetylase (PgdA/CDA1 family)
VSLIPQSLVVGLGLAAAVAALTASARRLGSRSLARRCAEGKTLCLTYDDGPGERTTPLVLDLLHAAGARATFFALGRCAEACRPVIERIAREGHEIGCHTFDHLNAWTTMPRTARADIDAGFRALAPWMRGPALFRPPYGRLTPLTWLVLRRRGVRVAWWTVDSGDTRAALPAPRLIVERVLRAGGGVVLLHDFDRSGPDAARRERHVMQTTEMLLAAAGREGLAIRRLGDVLGRTEGPYRMPAHRESALP